MTYKVEGKEEELTAAEESVCGGEDPTELSRLSVTLSCVGVGYSNFNKAIM